MRKTKHWLMTIAVLLCSVCVSAATYSDWTSTNKGQSSTTSSNTYNITANAGDALTFDWLVSSESNYDKLIITIGGTEILNKSGELSGTYQYTFTSSGTYTMVVKYTKDGSVNNGNDYAKIYNIKLITSTTIIASGNCRNSSCTWRLQTNGDLIIEGDDNMGDYDPDEGYHTPWLDYSASIKNAIIKEGVKSICEEAFINCNKLVSVTIPQSVSRIKCRTFQNCTNLTTINIPESITQISGDAFNNTAWYNNQPDGLVYINKVLYGYKGIKSSNSTIKIKEGTIGISSQAFQGCVFSLIVIPETVTSIGEMAFLGCGGELIVLCNIPSATIYEYYDSSQDEWHGAFQYSNFSKITIGDNVTSIAGDAFYDCDKLTSIIIPENVTYIGSNAFYNTPWYNNLPDGVVYINKVLYNYKGTMPNNTTIRVKEGTISISPTAFAGLKNLKTITIPKSVISIGYYALRGCSGLTSITCKAIAPPTIEHFWSQADQLTGIQKDIPVYVPTTSVSNYQAADVWKYFTNIQNIPTSISIPINQYGSGTYCSEHALDFSEVAGLKAYAATGYNTKTGVVTLTRVMTSKPGMGLFLKGEPGEYTVPTLESTDDNSLNMLVGTLEDVTMGKLSSDGRYANYKYTIAEGNTEPIFHNFDDGFTLGAGKAYLQIPVEWLPTMEARSIGIRFDDGDGTTDIEDAEIRNQKSEVVYDLMGRRVASPKKGELYIINGKKVIY